MKKAISLLLALVMCLSLCACGGGSGTPEATEPTLSSEWMSYLCGEWEVLYRSDEGKIENVTFGEDGTVTIGSKSATWKLEYQNDSEIRLQIADDDNIICDFVLEIRDNDLYAGVIQYNSNNISLYKPSYYEIITITEANWQEYFEERIIWEEEYNEFDELKYVTIGNDYVLKEQYWSRFSFQMMDDLRDENVIDPGAYETVYEKGSFIVHLDIENDTYTIENFEPTGTSSYVNPLSCVGGDNNFSFGGVRFTIVPDSEGRQQQNNTELRMTEVLRMKLSLYLIAE